jgi:PHD/YefM family antitoxin component YafN of YafNO toxin-antitoxin module
MPTQPISRELEDLVTASQVKPVPILRDGARAAVIVSSADFDLFDADLKRRRAAGLRAIELMEQIGKEAVEKGLTEEELERLLADES